MNDIPLEKSKFKEEFLKLNNDVFKVKYKKGGNRKCIIWLPGRNDYFYHYPENPRGYVGYAINNFLNTIKKEYKILLVTKNQIFIKKIN